MKHLASFALCALMGASTSAFAQAPASALAPVAPEYRVIPEASLPKPIFVAGGVCIRNEIIENVFVCARAVNFVMSTDTSLGATPHAIRKAARGKDRLNPTYTYLTGS